MADFSIYNEIPAPSGNIAPSTVTVMLSPPAQLKPGSLDVTTATVETVPRIQGPVTRAMNAIPTIGAPHLFGDEPALFERVLADGVHNYLEFGLGGSTLAAVRAGAKTVVAVDSNGDWVRAVQRHTEIAPLIAAGRASILHADIGPVGDWGSPADRTHAMQFHRYLAAPWKEWARREALPDLIYVDGRFRVSCCYSIAMVFAGADVPSPRILMHDMVPERPHYLDVFRCMDLVQQVDSLCLMRLKHDVQATDVLSDLLDRQFDYA